jgi:hypothetical protein
MEASNVLKPITAREPTPLAYLVYVALDENGHPVQFTTSETEIEISRMVPRIDKNMF